MLITHKSSYTCINVVIDTSGIVSNCNSICFDNAGNVDAKIHINFPTGGYILLKSGKSIDLGQRIETIIMDVFKIEFPIVSSGQCVNVTRETFQILD